MSDSIKPSDAAREELYDAIRQEGTFEEKARRALELGADYLDVENGHLTRIDPETSHWEAIVSTDQAGGQFPTGLELDFDTTYCKRTIEEDSQTVLYDAENQGWADERAFATHGLSCYLGTTLIVDDEPYGTVCFVSNEPREPFSDDETMFAELITRLLERELERRKHEKAFRRQANLSTVLNRVLRHNIRNNMAVIRGRTQLMADHADDSPHSETALRNIDELIELAEKARELEQIVGETSPSESTALAPLLTRLKGEVQDAYPHASITVDCENDLSVDVHPSFTQALQEVIENAAKHGGEQPTVYVTADVSETSVDIHVADDGPGLSEQERAVLRDGVETPLVHGSGLGLWLVHWIVSSHDGTIAVNVTDDGTTMTISVPRSRTEIEPETRTLVRSTDQYRAAFMDANNVMVITDDVGRILDANESAAALYDLSRDALLGRSIEEFFPEEFDFEAEWKAFTSGEKVSDTVTVIGGDDSEHVLEYAGTRDVVPGQHLFIARDITQARQQEADLKMKTEAIDAAPLGITIADATQTDNPIVYVNDYFCDLSGYEREEVLGRNPQFMQKGCFRTGAVDALDRAIATGRIVSTTVQNRRKDGSTFQSHLTIAPVKGNDGTVKQWIGFQQDVTERREHEEALQETTERLESIVAAVPNPIFAIDTGGKIIQWNEEAEAVLGYAASEVIGHPIQSLELIPNDQRAEFEEQFEKGLAGEWISEIEVQRQTKAGESIGLRLSPILLRDTNGAPTGLMIVAEHLGAPETAVPM